MLRPISRNSSIYSHGSTTSTSLLIPTTSATSTSATNKNLAECRINANLFLEFNTEITTIVKLSVKNLIAVGLMDGLVVVNTLNKRIIRRITTTNAPVVSIESCDCESSTTTAKEEEEEGAEEEGDYYISLLFTTTSSDSVVYFYNDLKREVLQLNCNANHSHSISFNSFTKTKEYLGVFFVTSSLASNSIQLYSRDTSTDTTTTTTTTDDDEVQLLTREYFPFKLYGRILKVTFLNSFSKRRDPLMLICMENGSIILYNFYTQTIVKNISATAAAAATATAKGKVKADEFYIQSSKDFVIICCVYNNSTEIKVLKYHNYNFTQLYDVKTGGKFRVKHLSCCSVGVDGKVLLFVVPSSNYKSKLLYGSSTSTTATTTNSKREFISPVVVYHNGRISNEIVLKDDQIKGLVTFDSVLYCGSGGGNGNGNGGKGLGYLSSGRELYEFRMKQ